MTFLEKPYMKLHLAIAAFLTLLIGIVVYCFSVDGYDEVISHPQFPDVENFDTIIQFFRNQHTDLTWYTSFFIVDLVWAPTILFLFFRIVTHRKDVKGFAMSSLAWLLLFFSFLAYAFDVLENVTYLALEDEFVWGWSLYLIVSFKKFFYAFVILLFLAFLYQQFVASLLSEIKFAIKATRFSLLIILLLLLLSTGMDQGSTVIIHLLEDPWSLIGTVVFLNMLALACSHYPDYIAKNMRGRDRITWDMKPKWLKEKLGIGFILYSFTDEQQSHPGFTQAPERQSKLKTSPFFENFRKNLGSLLWLTWIYVLLFIYKKYTLPDLPLNNIMLAFTVLFGLYFRMAYRAKDRWEAYFKAHMDVFAGKTNSSRPDEMAAERRKWIREGGFEKYLYFTMLSFVLLLLFTIISAGYAMKGDWEVTGKWLMVASFFSLSFFVFFQHFRKVFTYYLPPWYLGWTWMHRLNNDLTYIKFFATMGWLGFGVIFFTTREPSVVNALLLILLFFYGYYGFFIVLLKHHIYYDFLNDETGTHWWTRLLSRFFKTYAPILPMLLGIWIVFTTTAGNGLHVLWPVKMESEGMSLESYLQRFQSNPDTLPQNRYLVASYGGGLRASVWTMLLLDEMENSDPGFFASTIAMSGVSGGFVGLSMYNAIRTEYQDTVTRSAKVEDVGRHNILSIEISYLLGFDFLRENVPYWDSFACPDRAGRTMQEYASLIQPDKVEREALMEKGFRDYWAMGMDTAKNRFMPALIGNTTGTHGRYGVAFSVTPKNFNAVFPGAVDILTLRGGKSIRYLDATSTTERFPIFSPSAQIKEKGNFMDGGYFENSGLLSLMNLYDYVREHHPNAVDSGQTKVILIINSKESYIRHVLGNSIITKKELATGEFGAILNTVANIDVLPTALESRCENEFGKNFVRIYLPYPIRYSDVVDLIRGTPDNPIQIQEKINASNKVIEDVWKTYTDSSGHHMVPPALARVLSTPAFEYTKAMLKHPEVKSLLQSIKD